MEDKMCSAGKQLFSVFAPFLAYSGITVEGRFWKLAGFVRVKVFLQLMLCILIGLLLNYRSMVYAQKQGRFDQWFEWEWCLELVYMYLAIHAAICFFTVISWNRADVLKKFPDVLLEATPDKMLNGATLKSLCRRSQPFLFALTIFFVLTGALTTVETVVHEGLVSPMDNSTMALYRTSIFKTNWLFPADVFLLIYSLLLQACCLSVFYLMNQAVLLEYRHFQEDLEEKIKSEKLLLPEHILSFNLRQLRLSNVFKYIADHAGGLVALSFLSGFVIVLFGMFALTAFHESRKWFEMAIFVMWFIAGQLLLFVPISKLGAIQKEISRTQELLLTEESIWASRDQNLIREANAFLTRLERSKFPFMILSVLKADDGVLSGTMLFCSVVIYIFFYFRKIQTL